MKRLVIATKNAGKAREVAALLSDLPYEVVSLADYPEAPDVEETGSTFIENAILKATAYAEFTGELTLADPAWKWTPSKAPPECYPAASRPPMRSATRNSSV